MENGKKRLVLITGAGGRIGKAIIKRIADQYKVIGFDRSSAVFFSEDEEIIPLDVSNRESMISTFHNIKIKHGNKIHCVIHLAAFYSFEDNSSFKKYQKITVEGTRLLLQLLQSFEVDQFMFSSTMLVHKETPVGKKIKEEDPLCPYWNYPKSKIITESVIQEERGSIKQVTIIRMSGIYDDMFHSIPLSTQLQRVMEKQLLAFFYPGKRTHGNPFLHMDDLVSLIVLAMEKAHSLPDFVTLLATEDKSFSYIELHQRMSKALFGYKFPLIWVPKFAAKIGSFFLRNSFIKPFMIDIADLHYDCDCSKAKNLLGWRPQNSLDKKLEQLIAWAKNNLKDYYRENNLIVPRKLEKLWSREDAQKKPSR
ncbi:MAG: NAD(P)-dependent oxidoreductase [Chlamydiae bacterium]|nr:NAD(P)-dependent oxidoreductase [Chlamydiota bacterium]